MNTIIKNTSLVVLTAAILTGCGDKASDPIADDPTTDAPALPSAATMTFDLGFFGDGEEAQRLLDTGRAGSQLNWLNAAVRVLYVNVSVLTLLHDPVHAFAAAIHQDPVLQDDESYLWSFSFTEDGTSYQIDLTGRLDGVHVDWELAVTSPELGLDGFIWFYGESSIIADEGFWVFNNEDEMDGARLDYDFEGAEQSLSLEVVDPADEDFGDSLAYDVAGDMITLTYDDVNGDDDGVISWNEVDGDGFIQVADYNDGERACWDTEQMDVECPEIAS